MKQLVAGGIPRSIIMKIASEIIEAIRALHSDYHIIHGDIKPENVLLNNSFDVRLCDFGFAKMLEPGSNCAKKYTPEGTRNYMPPEILGGVEPLHPPMGGNKPLSKSTDT
ncbi:Protein kinase domain [Pelomyxa schiedti]|nr:Protein kinase domain [Pelomyxa schiedti]